MVFLTLLNAARCKGPDQFWRKRRVFKLTQFMVGRRRNCYSIAIRNLHRALQYSRIGRGLKRRDIPAFWTARLGGACLEANMDPNSLCRNLAECDIALNRKMLSELAIWEPRTFQCLTSLAITKEYIRPNKKGLNELDEPPEGVITRGML